MQDFITRENIAHFRALLAQDLSVERRVILEELLAAEEAKLSSQRQETLRPTPGTTERSSAGQDGA